VATGHYWQRRSEFLTLHGCGQKQLVIAPLPGSDGAGATGEQGNGVVAEVAGASIQRFEVSGLVRVLRRQF